MATDQVTHQKIQICSTCVSWPDVCFICGLPVRKDFTRLTDGRFLCARDAATAVLDNEEARRICDEVKDSLDRLFSRFLAFPETNVEIAIIDRVSLLAFKVPGNDFKCPNLLGYIQSKTNHGGIRYVVSLMSALPLVQFKATLAHEYAHAWVFSNVSPARRRALGPNAHEGFCELLAYMLMDSQGEEEEKSVMLKNTYTRGQLPLFIEAEKRYGFNDIVEWIKYGTTSQLEDGDRLGEVRNIQTPPPPPPRAAFGVYGSKPTPDPDTLVLRGLSSARAHPLAIINDQTLAVGETANIRIGTTNVLVRCLAIGKRSVRIQLVDSGQEQELELKPR